MRYDCIWMGDANLTTNYTKAELVNKIFFEYEFRKTIRLITAQLNTNLFVPHWRTKENVDLPQHFSPLWKNKMAVVTR